MKKKILYLFGILLLLACGGGDDGGVTPSSGNEYLNIPKDLTVLQGNTTTTLQINASPNSDWTISCNQSWVSFSQQSGRGAANVTVTVTANPSSSEARTAIITVRSSSYARECTLKQEPNSAYLHLSESSLTFSHTAGSRQFMVSSNAEWTIVESDEDWITVSPRTKTGENTLITVSVKDNTSISERQKTFTISSAANTSKFEKVNITQEAATPPMVSALTCTDVTRNEAMVSFNYTSIYPVTEYGVCYSTTENPTVNSQHTTETGSLMQGSYSNKLTGLSAGTTYHLRAYAKSIVDISYSDEIVFTTAQGEQPNAGDNPQPGW